MYNRGCANVLSSTICMMSHLASRLRHAAKGTCFETGVMAVLMIDAMFSTLRLSNPNSRQVAPVYQLDRLCKGTLQFVVPPRLCGFQAYIFRSVVGTHAR